MRIAYTRHCDTSLVLVYNIQELSCDMDAHFPKGR